MTDSIAQAKEELIQRFIAAYRELDRFDYYNQQTSYYKYANTFSYVLDKYDNGTIAAGSKEYDSPPGDKDHYGKYGFNEQGFLTTAEIFIRGNLGYKGFFVKQDDLVEYIEYNIVAGAVSCIQRIVLKDGKKVLYQNCNTNGRRGFNIHDGLEHTIEEAVRAGFDNGHSAICTIEEYEYDGDLINRAYGVHIMPGAGAWTFEDVYTYANDKLAQIKSYYDNGNTNIKYMAPSGKSLKMISDELAAGLANYIIDDLLAQNITGPLFSVELSYQYCYNYWPHTVIISEQEKEQAIIANEDQLFVRTELIYAVIGRPAALEELYTEFYQNIEEAEDWEAGRTMLKEMAKHMTSSKLDGKIPVSDDFITFPIEWVMDMDNVESILLQCGAAEENIAKWKSYGWV